MPTGAPAAGEGKRFRIRVEWGECVVARLHGRHEGRTALLQPDGQIGFPKALVPTDDPFVPMSADVLRGHLQGGPFAGFQFLKTDHYLIFFQSSRAFAEKSGRLLEDLYRGLLDFGRRHDLPVHEAEFPLVAVIFATERDFRAHEPVPPEVQAYYQIHTNRIFFYDQSERDEFEPKVMALRKPQTVAHEGAHQILANIGVQPRLADWPLWLAEGFAEYCATPGRTSKRAPTYDRIGWVNPLHMATLRELGDPLANAVTPGQAGPRAPAGTPRLLDVECLVQKADLTPTDYAQAWALTYYLTHHRTRDFVLYVKWMSRMPPLELRTPSQHLADFRRFFGDPARLAQKAEGYIRKLAEDPRSLTLRYYAVIVELPLGGGMVRRMAWISQSPQVIQRLIEQTIAPQGGPFNWQAVPCDTRAQAEQFAEAWIRGN